MSETRIKPRLAYVLWGKAGGRCQYTGCPEVLYRDPTTKSEFNQAYIAHIIADKASGPRGDAVLSPLLAEDISNLMLMCDKHHRLIDIEDVAGHSVERLRQMKHAHETQMDLLQSLVASRQSHVLIYRSSVGQHNPTIDFKSVAQAMIPEYFPAHHEPIELGQFNSVITDFDDEFWLSELKTLRRQFQLQVRPLLATHKIKHLSVFGFAKIPLLMELGRLLSDISTAEVYECHREPPGWKWQDNSPMTQFTIEPPVDSDFAKKQVALILSLSGRISHDRIQRAVTDDVAIWEITHPEPKPGSLKSRASLSAFREVMRTAFDRIKAAHGYEATLHVFPAVPVSAALEVGRVWMPNADLPFHVYDQNRAIGGFNRVHSISQPKQEAL